MGEYTLDSIVALPVSPWSYWKPTTTKKPSASSMTLFGTFVQSAVPLEAEKEEWAIKDWIYREEEDEEVTVTTPIFPKRYGKGYKILTKMGYQGHGSLTGHKNALVEPLSHTQGRDTRDTIGLGFGLENDIPTCDQRLLMSSELEDDDPPMIATTSQDEDFVPLTSLHWGE